MTPPPGAFSTVQRVRFGDLDAMQHMNNVEFLRFFETARIDYMLQLSPEHAPTERKRFGFIFAECHISYKAPAFFGDSIRTFVWPNELRRSSLRLAFEMRAEGDDDRLVAEGWGTLVGYDYEAGRPQPIPDVLRERVEPVLSAPDAVG
ncbi:MAG: acyl-CoA thioester hydrolase [Thermoleophilaceae bacterium]|jgi:acyl-CoA thioester hydrolase|nr:acyl-CoA thioester hydrolase [Thermoleophilaceae bacterium]